MRGGPSTVDLCLSTHGEDVTHKVFLFTCLYGQVKSAERTQPESSETSSTQDDTSCIKVNLVKSRRYLVYEMSPHPYVAIPRVYEMRLHPYHTIPQMYEILPHPCQMTPDVFQARHHPYRSEIKYVTRGGGGIN